MTIALILGIAGENGTTVTPGNGWPLFVVITVVLIAFMLAGEIAGRRGDRER